MSKGFLLNTVDEANIASPVPANKIWLFASESNGKPVLRGKLPNGSFLTFGNTSAFYQCASVDTAAGTWTGYKWNLNEEGVYELETELTTDELTVMGFEPVVGYSYSADTLIMAGKLYAGADPMPSDGLVFHASLASNAGIAETGQELTEQSATGATSIVYQTFKGVPCGYFSGENYITFSDAGLPVTTTSRSCSLWLCTIEETYDSVLFAYGNEQLGAFLWEGNKVGSISHYNATFAEISSGKWYHITIVIDIENGESRFYLDGVKMSEGGVFTEATDSGVGTIGNGLNGNWYYKGYLAGIRVYDRVLSVEEIKLLNQEFRTPYIDIADTLSINFKLNEAISHSLNAKDSLGNACSYEIVSGTLPAGVEFDGSTGIFSGTPTVEETVSVVIKCSTKKAEKEVTATLTVKDSELSVFGQLWGYKNGEILSDNTITATATGDITADADGNFTLGNGKYFDLDSTVLTGASPRTFIFHANLTSGNAVQFIDGGYRDTNRVFAIGYGYSGDSIFYHFWGNDNGSWLNLSPGSYIIAFTYDGSVLTCYVNGEVLGTYETALDTGTETKYRIGQYVLDDWCSSGGWKSKFYAVYDRALTQDEIAQLTDEINNA